MDLDDLNVGDRVEVYTDETGTYWGFVTEIGDDHVLLDQLAPDGVQNPGRERVAAGDVVRVIPGVKRPHLNGDHRP